MSVLTLEQRLVELRDLRRRIDAEIRKVTGAIDDVRAQRAERRSRHERPPCGTDQGYEWHRYREERVTCADCKAAHSLHVTEWQRAKRQEQRKAS
jgi:hypothetical protein